MEKNEEDLLELAKNNQQQGKFPQAIEAYQKFLAVVPDHFEAWVGIGKCYLNIGDNKRSMMALVQVISLNSMENTAWRELANLFHERKMEKEALFCEQKAGDTKKPKGKSVKPVAPIFWSELSRLKRLGDLPKCINCGEALDPPAKTNVIVECKSCHYYSWWDLPE